jgi:hypothetical protein
MEVRDLLATLLGRDVVVGPAAPLAPGPRGPATIGVYVDDLLRITAVLCTDLALSARAGAALGLLPVTVAEAAIESRSLDEGLRENLYEVLNVSTSLFNAPGADHVRLYAMHAAGDPLPPDAQARALTLGRRLDLAVGIGGYGSGRFSMVLCPDGPGD